MSSTNFTWSSFEYIVQMMVTMNIVNNNDDISAVMFVLTHVDIFLYTLEVKQTIKQIMIIFLQDVSG